MKDNLKFLSCLFVLEGCLRGRDAVAFHDGPISLDGKKYIGAVVSRAEQSITLAEGDGSAATGLLEINGVEDWPDGKWDALRDGLLKGAGGTAFADDNLRKETADILCSCMDKAFAQGKSVGAGRDASRERHVLTCIDGEGTLVSVRAFATYRAAHDAMAGQAQEEADGLVAEGWGEDDVSVDLQPCHAVLRADVDIIRVWDISSVSVEG